MPFYCSKRSASICVVLGPKKSSTYSSEYASGFSEPAASHLPAAPLLRNEGLLGQTPSPYCTLTVMVWVAVTRSWSFVAPVHGDLVGPLAQAFKLPFKTFLILIVHVCMDMRTFGALGQIVLHLKLSLTLSPSLGDVIITFDPSSIGALAGLSPAKTGAPLRQPTNATPNPMNPIRPITCIATSLFEPTEWTLQLTIPCRISSCLNTNRSPVENI